MTGGKIVNINQRRIENLEGGEGTVLDQDQDLNLRLGEKKDQGPEVHREGKEDSIVV